MVQREIQAANVELLNIKIMIEETKGYTLSVDTYKKAKALGMKDPRYYIYASLRGSGMPMRDCWAISFQGEGFNWTKDVQECLSVTVGLLPFKEKGSTGPKTH